MTEFHAERTTVVIVAGGRGSRLWPLSTAAIPKPFRSLISEQTMIQLTYERAEQLTDRDNIYVVTSSTHAALMRKQLPNLPQENLIEEPENRDTAPAIGLAAIRIAQRIPDAVMVLLASDHLITPIAGLQESVARAVAIARQGDYLVSIGVAPTEPNVEFGYMKCGTRMPLVDAAYFSEGYVEKPDRETAAALVATGSCLWNVNIFAWKIATLLAAFHTYRPDLHEVLMELQSIPEAEGQPAQAETARVFRKMQRISIDHAIMERVQPGDRCQHVFVQSDILWSDVGSIRALADTVEPDGAGNRCRGAVEVRECVDCVLIAKPPFRLRATRLSRCVVLVGREGDILVAPLTPGSRLADLVQVPLCQSEAPAGLRLLVNARAVEIETENPETIGVLDMNEVKIVVAKQHVTVSGPGVVGTGHESVRQVSKVRVGKPSTILVCVDQVQLSERAAALVVEEIAAILARKGRAVVSFAAGGTPERTYELLRTRYRHAVDWTKLTVVLMDDYLDLPPDSTFRNSYFLHAQVIAPLGIREFLLLDGTSAGLGALEERLAALGGLDLVLHGIGRNGHIGYNEPGSSFRSTARVVELAASTRAANSRFFPSADLVPQRGVTLGLALLGTARSSIVLASGAEKHAAVRQAILGPTTEELPATVLRQCPSLTYMVDESAWTGK